MSAAGVGPGERLAGRFVVISEIGRGGIARVFSAMDEALGHEVALKVLLPQYAEQRVILQRFRREAEVCRRLAHPNIVRVYDLHEDGDRCFISMERVQGATLAERLHAFGPPRRNERIGIIRGLCEALAFAHAKGVVHRDLKPQNVMIDANGTPRLLDFGLARVESVAGLTSHSVLLGTPDYMAPEAAAGLPVDARADVYSLGVLWFELCTGRRPFSASGALDLLRRMADEDGPAPAGADTDASEAAAVAACLRHEPHKRPHTIPAVLQRLDQAIPAALPLPELGTLCSVCGTESPAAISFCLGCGAHRRAGRHGTSMVVLTRMDGDPRPVVSTILRLDAAPDPSRDPVESFARTPVVLLSGLSSAQARAVQTRLLAMGATTEVRDVAEDNFDLLHRSGTPGLFLVGGLLLAWAALVWAGWFVAGAWGVGGILLLGPPFGWLLQRRAHLFLAPLFRSGAQPSDTTLPLQLGEAWRHFLEAQPSTALRRLGESVLLRTAAARPERSPAAAPLRRHAVEAAAAGLEVLTATAEVDRELSSADPRAVWAQLESAEARFRRTGDPAEAAFAATREADLLRLGELESRRTARLQGVLDLLDALDAAGQSATAGEAGLSDAVERLRRTSALHEAAEHEVNALEPQP